MADGQEHPHRRTGWREPRRLPPRGDDDGQEAAAGGPSARSARGRLVRRLAVGLALAVLLAAAVAASLYLRLDGNIKDLPLFGGVGGDAGTERPDAFGRTPLNVLVIGSDTRADRADCRLGGACGAGQNADAMMVLHLSADRSHATVLSIPRDTVADLPACRAPKGRIVAARRGPVNATLQLGPGCTVAAVHTLTRIPIDHFVMADFSGVVRMSNAVGGVRVCVDRNVYDPYSRLRLTAGRHTLKGQAALEFLRSRHAFGDGSDLGRTQAQHLFLGALAQQLRKGGSITDPAGMLALADAATSALTVDTGLAAVHRLTGLADDVRKVPSGRFVFATMPSRPDPRDRNRLLPGPAADPLFARISADLPVRVTVPPPAAGTPAAAPGGSRAAAPREDRPDRRAGRVPPVRGLTAAAVGCAKVAREPTVSVRGVAMTPTAAFAATPTVPVSAR
jgi:LCP family protein required for cell wall assembly